MKNTRTLHMIAAAVTMLAACVTDEPEPDERSPLTVAGHQAVRANTPMAFSQELSEMKEITQDALQRLRDRGHTVADLQAAAEAGDVPRLRELLGMNAHEYTSYRRRFTIAAERFLDPTEPPRAPGRRGPPRPRADTQIEEDADCDYVSLSICALAAAKIAKDGGIVGWVIAIYMMRECLCKWCWGVTSVC